jgi:hypothetical protein
MDEFNSLALRLAKAPPFDADALTGEFVNFLSRKLEDFESRGLCSHAKLEAGVFEAPYDGTYAGSVEGPTEVIISSNVLLVDGQERAAKEGERLLMLFVSPMASALPWGGAPRLALALMGKERFFEKQWRSVVKNLLQTESRLRQKHGWALPAGVAALSERESLDAALGASSPKAAPKGRSRAL